MYLGHPIKKRDQGKINIEHRTKTSMSQWEKLIFSCPKSFQPTLYSEGSLIGSISVSGKLPT